MNPFLSQSLPANLAELRALVESMLASSHLLELLVLAVLVDLTLVAYSMVRGFGVRKTLHGLQQREERLLGIFDAHPLPMYVFDRETQRFLAVNKAAIAQYGYDEAEFLAMGIQDLRLPEDVQRFEQRLQRIKPGTQSRVLAGVWRHRRRDGSVVNVDVSHHALTFMGRDAIFVLAEDVTAQIAAEAEAQRSARMLETVLDNIPQRVFWKDREGRYLG
jgi:PAS domain S-box-containing protein